MSNEVEFEVYSKERPIRWEAFVGADPTVRASGTARTRLGLMLALLRARRRVAAGGEEKP